LAHSLVIIALVTAICGVPFGLLLRSGAEARRGSPEPTLFVPDGFVGMMAMIFEKAIFGLALFFVPSLGVLWLIDEIPAAGVEMRVWLMANLLGAGLGKWVRWHRWRRTQDLL